MTQQQADMEFLKFALESVEEAIERFDSDDAFVLYFQFQRDVRKAIKDHLAMRSAATERLEAHEKGNA